MRKSHFYFGADMVRHCSKFSQQSNDIRLSVLLHERAQCPQALDELLPFFGPFGIESGLHRVEGQRIEAGAVGALLLDRHIPLFQEAQTWVGAPNRRFLFWIDLAHDAARSIQESPQRFAGFTDRLQGSGVLCVCQSKLIVVARQIIAEITACVRSKLSLVRIAS
jgi:hypothetical protein